MICKNCAERFEGNFCGNCGQKAKVKRINLKYLMTEIPDSIFQIDRGFLFTVKQLTLRPGHSIREFLNGKRKPYYKPFAFFLITSTVYFLLPYLFDINTFVDDLLLGFRESMKDNNESTDSGVLDWISRNQTYFILLFIPLFSFASYLAFIKWKYNYIEHLVINIYITGYQMIIYSVFSFMFSDENIFVITPLVIGFFYNFWTFNQLFDGKSTWKKVLVLILTYIIFLTELLLLIFVIVWVVRMVT